jgi:uncharacterized membrane protein
MKADVTPTPGPTTTFNVTLVRLHTTPGVNASLLTVKTDSTTTAKVYTVTVTGTNASGTPFHSVLISVTVTLPPPPKYDMVASPKTLTVQPGKNQNSTITLTSVNGFAGNVFLQTVIKLSSGALIINAPDLVLNVSFVKLVSSGSNSSLLTITSKPTTSADNYTVTVVGTAGILRNSTTIIALLPGFNVTAGPPALFIQAGKSASSMITLSSVLKFTDTVSLTTIAIFANGTIAHDLDAMLNPTSVIIPSGGTISSTLSITTTANTEPGGYSVNVTIADSSGAPNMTITISLDVGPPPGFEVVPMFNSLTVRAGASTSTTVTIVGFDSFNGTISLTATSLPAGSTATFDPATVTLTSATFIGTTTLTIQISTSTLAGTYTVIVTGTNNTGTPVSSAQVSLVVTKPTANIKLDSVGVQPNSGKATIGQSVTVAVAVENTGAADGNFTLEVKWMSITVASQQETLAAGATKAFFITWDTTGYSAGSSAITVTSSTGTSIQGSTVTLSAPSTPFLAGNQALILAGGSAAAIIVIAGAYLALRLRRKTSTAQ